MKVFSSTKVGPGFPACVAVTLVSFNFPQLQVWQKLFLDARYKTISTPRNAPCLYCRVGRMRYRTAAAAATAHYKFNISYWAQLETPSEALSAAIRCTFL